MPNTPAAEILARRAEAAGVKLELDDYDPAPVYIYGGEGTGTDYHDHTCPCDHHCANCGRGLEGRQRLYCSPWCGRRYRAELEFEPLDAVANDLDNPTTQGASMSRSKQAPPLADVLASLPTIGVGRAVEAHVEQRRRLRDGRTVAELDTIAQAIVEADEAGAAPQMGWLLIRLAESDNAAMKAAIALPGAPLPATPFLDALNRRASARFLGAIDQRKEPEMPTTKTTEKKPAAKTTGKQIAEAIIAAGPPPKPQAPKPKAEPKLAASKRTPVRYVCDGRVMPDNQNRLSSVAYQYTRGIAGEKVARIGSADLTKLLAKLGVKDGKAPGWTVTLPNGVEVSCFADGTQPVSKPKAKKAAARKPAAAPPATNGARKASPKAAGAKKAGAASTPLKKAPAPRKHLAAVPSA